MPDQLQDNPNNPASSKGYLDFELEIGPGEGGRYSLVVLKSPAGEARATVAFPYDELALERNLDKLQIALLRRRGGSRLALSDEENLVQQFGQSLFEFLLSGEARSRFDVSRSQADQQGLGLRLKLRIQPPELAALPWEFLYDPRQAEYLCLTTGAPLVRYLAIPQPIQPLTVQPPLRILGMIAGPTDLQKLDVDTEKERLQRALADLQAQGQVQLTWLAGSTWRDLQRALRGGPWHIFHFIGHGGYDENADEGLIVLENDDHSAHRLGATQLARLLADHRPLRLALLNACEGAHGGKQDIFSSTASILVRRGLPAVLAMQYPITDRAAIELTRSFYEALADGWPVDACVAEARKAISISIPGSLEWGTPVLHLRAPDGVLFRLQPPSQSPAGKSRAPSAKRQKSSARTPATKSQTSVKQTVDTVQGGTVIGTFVAGPGSTITFDAPPSRQESTEKSQPPIAKSQKELGAKGRAWAGIEFVRIPVGKFLMGSKEDDARAYDDEKPQHTVEIGQEFWIGRCPVTNTQFAAFVQASGYRTTAEEQGSGYAFDGKEWKDVKWADWQHPRGPKSSLKNKDEHPVVQVSWLDARAYCGWLNQAYAGELPAGFEFRLPSEAEWEKAARGEYANEWPWSSQEPDPERCNFHMNVKDTTPVGRYSPQGDSPYGCADMAGNVWEWTTSQFKNYPYQKEDGREKMDETSGRVVRGGSFYDDARYMRCACRVQDDPNDRLDFGGFRVVLSPI